MRLAYIKTAILCVNMTINDDSIVYISIEVFIGILAVVGNSLVCYVVFESRSLRKKSMFIFLTSLAVADLLVGAVAIPFGILTKLGLPHNNPYLCIIMLSFIIVLTQISIFNLMTVSIERYLAIRHPRIHFNKLTPKISFRIIVITWLISILFGMLPIGWNNIPKLLEDDNELVSSNHSTSFALSQNDTQECHFLQIVNLNYMFFNFIVCVLTPLLVCAVLYSVILSSLVRVQSPTDKKNMRTYVMSRSTNSTPVLPRRESFVCKSNDNQVEKGLQQMIRQSNGENKQAISNSSNRKYSREIDHQVQEVLCMEDKGMNKKVQDSSRLQVRDKIETVVVLNDPSSRVSSAKRSSGHNNNITSTKISQRPNSSKKKKEIHAALVLGLIVLTFAICWLPIHILNTITRFTDASAVQIPTWVFTIAILLSHANSAVNFFLYSWRLKAFRNELNKKVIAKLTNFFSRK